MTINFINMEKLCALTIVWYVKGAQNMLFRPGSLPGARAGIPSKARGVWEYLCTYLAIGHTSTLCGARAAAPRTDHGMVLDGKVDGARRGPGLLDATSNLNV